MSKINCPPLRRNSSLDDPIRRTALEYQNPPHSARRIFIKAQFNCFVSAEAGICRNNLYQSAVTNPFSFLFPSESQIQRKVPMLPGNSGTLGKASTKGFSALSRILLISSLTSGTLLSSAFMEKRITVSLPRKPCRHSTQPATEAFLHSFSSSLMRTTGC